MNFDLLIVRKLFNAKSPSFAEHTFYQSLRSFAKLRVSALNLGSKLEKSMTGSSEPRLFDDISWHGLSPHSRVTVQNT